MTRWLCWFAIVWLFAPPLLAHAHSIGLSRGEYRLDGATAHVTQSYARDELAVAVPEIDLDADGVLSKVELAAGKAVLMRALLDGLDMDSAAGACTGESDGLDAIDGNGVQWTARYVCATAPAIVDVRLLLLQQLSEGHRNLLQAAGEPAGSGSLLYGAQDKFALSALRDETSSHPPQASMFALGVEHILTGFDHLVFLLGMVLVARRFGSLLVLVTAFTAGHMLTFGLAAAGWLAPDPGFIEPAIALTICYVGIENWVVRDARHRWLLAFPFGLIHGFGFGGALRELAVPGEELLRSLVAFNLGVEAGQLAALGLALPLLWWLRKHEWFARYGTQTLSALIALAGAGWFLERIS